MLNEKLIKEYIDATRALQEKFIDIKLGNLRRRNVIEQEFKPLIEPLQRIDSHFKRPFQASALEKQYLPTLQHAAEKKKLQFSDEQPSLQVFGPLASKYLGFYASKEVKTDSTFGICIKDGTLYVGNSPISVENDNIILNDRVFEGTPGLWQLLTLAEPELDLIPNEDLFNYENILLSTCAYRQNNDPNERVKSSNGNKYKTVVRPILLRNKLIGQTKSQEQPEIIEATGDGLGLAQLHNARRYRNRGYGHLALKKKLTNLPVEYVYWNKLDELLERLYILWGERKSGNSNPNLDNEIVNILQEIREI